MTPELSIGKICGGLWGTGRTVALACGLWCCCALSHGQGTPTAAPAVQLPEPAASEVLAPSQWLAVNKSIERGLAWMSRQQQADGSFPCGEGGQPAITSLSVMAFLAAGHLPDEATYGEQINRAIDYVLASQQPNGLICRYAINNATYDTLDYPPITAAGFSGIYNHAISSVMLGETYGITRKERARRIREAIERSIHFTRERQTAPKRFAGDHGGWRYLLRVAEADSDLLITAWNLMFLRSAKNAGFQVPAEWIDDAMAYIQRCFDPQLGTFIYAIYGEADHRTTRCITGAGILALSLGGLHATPMARTAGQWLLRYPFDNYNSCFWRDERYHYGIYYCSQAMFQLGADYWRQFYPGAVRTLLLNQNPEGCWAPESSQDDAQYGQCMTSAFAILALSTPYQLLPIYQR